MDGTQIRSIHTLFLILGFFVLIGASGSDLLGDECVVSEVAERAAVVGLGTIQLETDFVYTRDASGATSVDNFFGVVGFAIRSKRPNRSCWARIDLSPHCQCR